MKRIVVPRATVEELYAAAVTGDAEGPIRRFLEALGLSGFQGSTAEFRGELQSALLEKLGLNSVLSSIPGQVSPSPAALSVAARKAGVALSKTSAGNLLRLLEELGVVLRLRSWRVYALSTEDKVVAILSSRGEARISELERLLGADARRAVARLWAAGRILIYGSPRGPAPGPLGEELRELASKWGTDIPASEVPERLRSSPRLARYVERRSGKEYYTIVLRGDDRVVIIV